MMFPAGVDPLAELMAVGTIVRLGNADTFLTYLKTLRPLEGVNGEACPDDGDAGKPAPHHSMEESPSGTRSITRT